MEKETIVIEFGPNLTDFLKESLKCSRPESVLNSLNVSEIVKSYTDIGALKKENSDLKLKIIDLERRK